MLDKVVYSYINHLVDACTTHHHLHTFPPRHFPVSSSSVMSLTLTASSSPRVVYTQSTTYAQLCHYRHLPSITKLIRAITAYNHNDKLPSIDAAFVDHRTRSLDNTLHTRKCPLPAAIRMRYLSQP